MQRVNQALSIQSSNYLQLAHAKCSFELEILPGTVHWLVGENGVGKSSFYNYLKEQSKEGIIEDRYLAFLDQFPLAPLVNLSLKHMLDILFDSNVLDMDWINSIDLNDYIDLSSFENTHVQDLSGGQNQLLKLYLCFGQKRDFYFLDEPFLNLDLNRSNLLQKLIQKLCTQNKGILIIEHREKMMDLFDEKKIYKMRYESPDEVRISAC